jgi:N-acetylmuramoyl-L-alanine amidase
MIQITTIGGHCLRYVVVNPGDVGVELGIGKTVKELAQGSVIAINFNYADLETGTPIGRVIVDGKSVIKDSEKTAPREELYSLPDGSVRIGKAPEGAVWAVQGSPRLLQEGKNVVHASIQRDQTGADIWQRKTRRTAAGITADGKVVLVSTVDELGLSELAAVMASLGCVDALNGDGGGSSYLWPEDNGWGRKVGVAITVKETSKMTKPILIIDPGHGGQDPGGGSNEYFKEKDLVLEISKYQADRFRQLGVRVLLTRDRKAGLSPAERTRIIRDSGARFCISNHINNAVNAAARGAEVIHSIHDDGRLARALYQGIVAAGIPGRRVFTRALPDNSTKDYYFMHRDTSAVATIIIEYGFASNVDDSKLLSVRWRDYAEAVVREFCGFINHPYVPPSASTPPISNGTLPPAQREIGIQVNGQYVGIGYLINDTSYIPARVVAEKLGAKVSWDGKNVSITKELI